MNKKYFLIAIFFIILSWPCINANKNGGEDPDLISDEKIIPIGELIFESGVFPMHLATEVTKFEMSRGAEVDIISVAPSRDSWESLHNTWYMDDVRIPSNFKGTLNVALPMWPENGNLESAANGDYNSEWEKIGKAIALKFPTAYIRPGWEMNINDWYYKATPENATQWKQAFRHAVNSLRKGSSRFRLIFNPNLGPGQTGTKDATLFYPGDEYVDLIGIDAYDWWPGYTTNENIAFHRDREYGWNWWLDFAKSHNKKFTIPEWGIARANSNSGGDNPKYINFVFSWLKENKEWIQMECYFHETESYIRSDLFTGYNPKASAEYKRWMPLLKK